MPKKKEAGIPVSQYQLVVQFLTPVLGTSPKDPNVYASYIASQAPNGANGVSDELETLPEAVEDGIDQKERKGWTGFHITDEGQIVFYDYQLRGFFKEATSSIRRVGGSAGSKLTAFKKKIDGHLFIRERQIPVHFPDGYDLPNIQRLPIYDFVDNPAFVPGQIVQEGQAIQPPKLLQLKEYHAVPAPETFERPLRAQTPQGERVTVTRSDVLPAGCYFKCVLRVMGDKVITETYLRETLAYGQEKGLGQWRSGGWGKFVASLRKIEGSTIEPVSDEPLPGIPPEFFIA